jgi:signal transduction histidine kinase
MKTTFNRKITLRFGVIVGVLIIANLASYEWQSRQTVESDSSSTAAGIRDRQRMLLSRTAMLALLFSHAQAPSEKGQRREELLAAKELLQQSRQQIARLPTAVTGGPSPLDEQMDSYIAAVTSLAEDQSRDGSGKLDRVLDLALGQELSGSLEQAAQGHHQVHQAALASIQRVRDWSLRLNLVLVSMIGLWVFLPMARQIRADLADLAKLNLTLKERISSEKQTQAAMSQHARELSRSNSELEQFASVASHDLQEPLRKILAFGDRLEQKCSGAVDAEALDYLKRMRGAAARMQDLINGLLNYSRISSRAQPFERVDLSKVLREVLTDLETRIEEAAARIEVKGLPEIDADPMQMRQLLQNLIGNALKFHRPDRLPVIRIAGTRLAPVEAQERGYSPHEYLYEITVEDNGVGFDPQHAGRMFQVFQRLHSRKEFEGTGVGLAICRKIAERHGGQITAQSQVGHGAKFTITLPLRQVNSEQAA